MAAVESTATRDVERADRVVRGIVQGWYEMDYMNPYLLLDLADAYRRNGRPDLAIAVWKEGPRFYAGAFEMHLFLQLHRGGIPGARRQGEREALLRSVLGALPPRPEGGRTGTGAGGRSGPA
jgi:hypothetical protein